MKPIHDHIISLWKSCKVDTLHALRMKWCESHEARRKRYLILACKGKLARYCHNLHSSVKNSLIASLHWLLFWMGAGDKVVDRVIPIFRLNVFRIWSQDACEESGRQKCNYMSMFCLYVSDVLWNENRLVIAFPINCSLHNFLSPGYLPIIVRLIHLNKRDWSVLIFKFWYAEMSFVWIKKDHLQLIPPCWLNQFFLYFFLLHNTLWERFFSLPSKDTPYWETQSKSFS